MLNLSYKVYTHGPKRVCISEIIFSPWLLKQTSWLDIQETKAAFQARNEDRDGEWRCPGCQTHRVTPPGPYK